VASDLPRLASNKILKSRLTTITIAFCCAMLAACGSESASTPIKTVQQSPGSNSVRIQPEVASLTVGGSQQFTATITGNDQTLLPLQSNTSAQHPSNGTPHVIAWSSSNPQVAAIDARGVATALQLGATLITASDGSAWGSVTLTVTSDKSPPTLKSISILPTNFLAVAGAVQPFSAVGFLVTAATNSSRP
jgi:hypothetical protein